PSRPWRNSRGHVSTTSAMRSVPGHSCWPQNQPFDRNLALLISSITSLLGKSTTHKMPQSADLFALRLILAKGTFSPGTWPRYRSQRTLFVSRSADCWRRSGELGQQQQASPSAIDEHLPTFAP